MSRTPWSASVGFLPHKITVYEEPAREWTLYLRWRSGGNWKKRSLRRQLRTVRGKIDAEVQRWAMEQASAQYARLVAGIPDAERAPSAPLTIQQGLDRATDPKVGKYPTDTNHRREVVREMDRAIRAWGDATPWEAIKRSHLRSLWRARIVGLRAENDVGLRGAEITIQRVLAVAQWLRDEELIPAGACVAPRTWRQELRADWLELTGERGLPKPSQPRYTIEESRALLRIAPEVDPRYHLLLALAAELRPGQGVRARRSDLDLDHKTFTVYGRGHKRGEVVKLTAGQMRVVRAALETGYLREMESSCADYPLFPGVHLKGNGRSQWKDPEAGVRVSKGYTTPTAVPERHSNAAPVQMSNVRKWHRKAEKEAGIQHVDDRGPYGMRRAAVDAAKQAKISREGLKALGGWSDTQVPDTIYADQEMEYARDEAREVRARIRGEEA